MILALLVLLGASTILPVELHPDMTRLLPPVNFTITVIGLAKVRLSWKPNPDQQGVAPLEYNLKIDGPQEIDKETGATQSEHTLELHRGLQASVRTIFWDESSMTASAWTTANLQAPPGAPGSAAMNLTCSTNALASGPGSPRPYYLALNCSWCPGPDAPRDTQYFLKYRYGDMVKQCQEYRRDTQGRNVACWFPSTHLNGKELNPLVVQVDGSSAAAPVRLLDRLFMIPAIDRVNPPENVTAEIQDCCASIRWRKPRSVFSGNCFTYEVRTCSRKGDCLPTETMDPSLVVAFIDSQALSSVRVRAKLSSHCRSGGQWGEWSPPIHIGSKAQMPSWDWLPVVLTVAVCGALLATSLICWLFHLWTKLCPPVPAPKSSLKEFLVTLNYEKPGPSATEPEVVTCLEVPGLDMLGDTNL